jgi:hypothetical protein
MEAWWELQFRNGTTIKSTNNFRMKYTPNKKFLVNQVYIENGELYIPKKHNTYLEFGPVGIKTVLEEKLEEGKRSFLVSASGQAPPAEQERVMFMKCGKLRFIPGDIRPIE